jgi:hypothetical protein
VEEGDFTIRALVFTQRLTSADWQWKRATASGAYVSAMERVIDGCSRAKPQAVGRGLAAELHPPSWRWRADLVSQEPGDLAGVGSRT